MSDFAIGLKEFFTKGSLVKPVRLTPGMRKMIENLMEESLENTAVDFSREEDDLRYDAFMRSMNFLKNLIAKGSGRKIKMPKDIASTLYFWITSDHKYHHLSDEEDFKKAIQWIVNHISRQYSIGELPL